MQAEEIERKIGSFPRWHYEFDLRGHKTPIYQETAKHRHRNRAAYFFDTAVSLFGGSLEGKRVLDLGCNAGWWSLKAMEAGADYVLGIDGREMHVEQSRFVFEAWGSRTAATTSSLQTSSTWISRSTASSMWCCF